MADEYEMTEQEAEELPDLTDAPPADWTTHEAEEVDALTGDDTDDSFLDDFDLVEVDGEDEDEANL